MLVRLLWSFPVHLPSSTTLSPSQALSRAGGLAGQHHDIDMTEATSRRLQHRSSISFLWGGTRGWLVFDYISEPEAYRYAWPLR